MNNEYKLHSSGDNWYHFRKYSGTTLESFSVTYCHDGTVCMTGDYGCLCWQREWFPGLDRIDYGFPSLDTGINYFAEKVVRAAEIQNIKTWKKDVALVELNELLEEYESENNSDAVLVLGDIIQTVDNGENIGEYGHIKMCEAFVDSDYPFEEFYEFGICYTDLFERQFEMLQSVSSTILECVNRR